MSPRRALVALLLLGPARAWAQAAAPPPAPPPAPYWVDFEAGHVVLDPELMQLELSRRVTIRVDRYRLTSQRLTLRRTGRGVEVEGEGRVAFCPCENAPVSFAFRHAIVAPPTDLFVQNATLRLGDVPVLWTPVLWLRSPDRLGLLPPRLAWRGDDGLLAGAGVHVPLGGRRGPTLSAADLSVAGYLKGGVEVDTRLVTPTTSTHVRWDHLGQSLLALDAHGSAASRDGAVGAFRVDALRGARGLAATLDLEPAARRFDHARAAVVAAGGGVVGSLGAAAASPRGAAMDRAVAVGPVGQLGFGATLGAGSSVDSFLELSTLRERGMPSSSLVVHHAALAASTNAGPLLLSALVDEHAVLQSRDTSSQRSAFAGARAVASLPLVRAFGAGDDPLVHRVEPLADAGVRVAARSGDTGASFRAFEAAPPGRLGLGALGVRTALGRYAAREALELEAKAGGVGELGERELEPAAAASVAADGEWLGAVAESAARPDSERALHAAGRLRVGRADGLHLTNQVSGSLDDEPVLARALLYEHFDGTLRPFLDRQGWSAGSELGIPITSQVASLLATDADVSAARWLAWRAALAYRHPCGCFAVVGRAGQRLGRDGFDAEVTLDLMP